MIRYFKLFDLLNRRGMKKTDLLEHISTPTLAKLSKGEVITSEIIDRLCERLDCQPADIMEYVPGEILSKAAKECTKRCEDKVFTLTTMTPNATIQSFETLPSLRDTFVVVNSKTVKCIECGRVHKLKWLEDK